jgi:hypothetical protein
MPEAHRLFGLKRALRWLRRNISDVPREPQEVKIA